MGIGFDVSRERLDRAPAEGAATAVSWNCASKLNPAGDPSTISAPGLRSKKELPPMLVAGDKSWSPGPWRESSMRSDMREELLEKNFGGQRDASS